MIRVSERQMQKARADNVERLWDQLRQLNRADASRERVVPVYQKILDTILGYPADGSPLISYEARLRAGGTIVRAQ